VPRAHVRRVGNRAWVVVAFAIVALPACSGKSTSAHASDAQHLPRIDAEKARARIGSVSPALTPDTAPSDSADAGACEGVDSRGIPHYATTVLLSNNDAQVLRRTTRVAARSISSMTGIGLPCIGRHDSLQLPAPSPRLLSHALVQ